MSNKKIPTFQTDQEAVDFLEQDLSQYDISGFKRVHFEFEPKSKSMSLRMPEILQQAIQAKAESQGMKTQKFIRQALEHAVQ